MKMAKNTERKAMDKVFFILLGTAAQPLLANTYLALSRSTVSNYFAIIKV